MITTLYTYHSPIPHYFQLGRVSPKELNVWIWMVQEGSNQSPSFIFFLNFKEFPLKSPLVIWRNPSSERLCNELWQARLVKQVIKVD